MSSKLKKSTKIEIKTLATEVSLPEQPDTEARNLMIAEAAHYIAEHRGFSPVQETEDWLEAEHQVDEMLSVA